MLEDEDTEDPRALRDSLRHAIMDRRHRQVVFDLSRLHRLTGATAVVLVGAEACSATCGTPVAFACARRRVKRALAGMRDLLTVHCSVGQALEAMAMCAKGRRKTRG
jgi:anti-anti-sigma regulatory factor